MPLCNITISFPYFIEILLVFSKNENIIHVENRKITNILYKISTIFQLTIFILSLEVMDTDAFIH